MGDPGTRLPGLEVEELPPELVGPGNTDVTSRVYNVLLTNMSVTTEGLLENNASARTCDFIDTNYDIPTAVTCAVFFVLGILFTFFGGYFFN